MTYTVLDFETTGLNYLTEQVIEIGAIKLDDDFTEIGRLHTLVKLTEGQELKPFITELTGLTVEDTNNGVSEITGLNMLKDFIDDSTVVAQHAPFDLAFLSKAVEPEYFIDTRSLSCLINPDEKAGLKDLAKRYGVEFTHHRSISDVEATIEVLKPMLAEAKKKNLPVTNIVVKAPDRELKFIPLSAVVLDLEKVKEFLSEKEEESTEETE